MMNKNLIDLLKLRRSRYVLKKESALSDEEIVKLVQDAVIHTPSAFNSQSARAVVLFGKEHERLWDITAEVLYKIINNESAFASTRKKMDLYKGAYGTVLFFEDIAVIEGLQSNFPLYKDSFPVWSHQSAGMLNLVVWTALAENNMGASLQHYNPLIDEQVKQAFEIPARWKLIAQMPFGISGAADNEKTFVSVEQRVWVRGM